MELSLVLNPDPSQLSGQGEKRTLTVRRHFAFWTIRDYLEVDFFIIVDGQSMLKQKGNQDHFGKTGEVPLPFL